MEKRNKIIYWIATGLLSALMLMSASMYIFNYEMVSQTFVKLGFPVYIIYPLAAAKILGLIAILTKKSKFLKEWAYAGFFFDFVLALSAHLLINDGAFLPAIVAIVLLIISYRYDKKIFA
ncbi:DoxX family protein [Ancylomarina sp. 16SWW S1-10-2]|uniref:DoxX family protein n=1 Tax=Ancylomarina sp. 16SWW S1-10-2 TaxID=2499681 RepID=UPI0012AE5171|nr:DoxX family protein [Ancylomarina sp. 16SWW S1-10-2]MRT91827.1 DoxX family protein [Ancylomarina sp. 16SWW S1-10-2]